MFISSLSWAGTPLDIDGLGGIGTCDLGYKAAVCLHHVALIAAILVPFGLIPVPWVLVHVLTIICILGIPPVVCLVSIPSVICLPHSSARSTISLTATRRGLVVSCIHPRLAISQCLAGSIVGLRAACWGVAIAAFVLPTQHPTSASLASYVLQALVRPTTMVSKNGPPRAQQDPPLVSLPPTGAWL